MDDLRRLKLQEWREQIVQDLDVKVVLDKLFQCKVLAENDIVEIQIEKTLKDRARRLLDLLACKDNEAYDTFVDCLEEDYNWLAADLKLSNSMSLNEDIEDRIFADALTLGDLPRAPLHYIPRNAKLEELEKHLRKMQRGDYVSLHGMPGAGKSCLAAATLRNKTLLKECFNNRIFWINVGDASTDTDLVFHLLRLYSKLDIMDNNKCSSRQSMNVSDGIDLTRDTLRWAFTKEPIRNGLLILDDVTSLNVIKAFNLDCKILVTTRDLNVVPKSSESMTLLGGFTEYESLKLFADCVDVDVAQLPPQAKEINTLCKGGPMLIALIGSLLQEHREDAKVSSQRWNYYVDRLRKREYEFSEYQPNAIGLCVESLSSDLREYYKTFALFVEDVNIMPEVLQTIWKLDKYRVEDIMISLKNKSLVVSVYNRQMKSFVYGIHDLLLAYLKKKLTAPNKIALHSHLISSYRTVCNNKFANLPNDNYIFSYIGYHLAEAELFSEFTNLYLDLDFIGAKLRIVGTADLSADFKRYRDYITNNDPVLCNTLNSFEQFVLENGHDLHKFHNIDIVQRALQQVKSGEVYKQAVEVAKQRPERVYLQLALEGDGLRSKLTVDVPHKITTACFTSVSNRILIGQEDGKITLWMLNYNALLYTFHGHTQPIKSLIMHRSGEEFISTSLDGTVKLWNLDDTPSCNSLDVYDENGFADRTPSPRTRQANWSNLYGYEEVRDRSRRTYSIPDDEIVCAALSHDGELLVTGSRKGLIVIWDLINRVVTNTIQISTYPHCCSFSIDDKTVLVSYNNCIEMRDIDPDNPLVVQIQVPNPIKILKIIPESINEYIAIGDSSVDILTMEMKPICISKLRTLDGSQNGQVTYISGAVTVDGKYVAVGTSNYIVRMWNLETETLVREMLDNNGLIICLDTFLHEVRQELEYLLTSEESTKTHLLLSVSDDNILKQWELPTIDLSILDNKKLKGIFSAKYNNHEPYVAAIDNENHILLFKRLMKIADYNCVGRERIITTIDYCVPQNASEMTIAVGCDSGEVYEISIMKGVKTVIHLDKTINYLEYVSDSILVAGDKQGSLIVRQNQKNTLLTRGQLANDAIVQRFQHNKNAAKHYPFMKCFILKSTNKLIAITQDRIVKCWNLNTCQLENILLAPQNTEVTMCSLNRNQNSIAFTHANNTFQIFNLNQNGIMLEISLYYEGTLESPIRSCCFSYDGSILALGLESGKIIIWNVVCKSVMTQLELHRSCVRYMCFSPSVFPVVLVSVGEQIAWWDISYIQQQSEHDLQRRKRGSGRFAVTKIPSLQNLQSENSNGTEIRNFWANKQGMPNKRELLACIKLRGTYATYLQASPDFTSFTTVDNYGLIYIMDVFTPN